MAAKEKPTKRLWTHAVNILAPDDVLDGVPDLVTPIRLEVTFDDGNKLIYVENPIR